MIWLLVCLDQLSEEEIKFLKLHFRKYISFVFITQSYFSVPENSRLNSTHYLIMKIPNKQELYQIAFNYLSGVESKDFMNFYKKFTAKSYSFLIIDSTLASDN